MVEKDRSCYCVQAAQKLLCNKPFIVVKLAKNGQIESNLREL